ncbi:MAG: M4 family metallopeptidase, partial [Flavobacteriales bacterium]|nr:M4 family metallopeptidase [Flavobacteriales bacterium]
MAYTIKNIFKNTLIIAGLLNFGLMAQSDNRILEAEYNNSNQLFYVEPHPSWSKTSLQDLPEKMAEIYSVSPRFGFAVKSEIVEDRFVFTRVEQTIGGYPVVEGDMVMKRDKEGSLLSIFGTLREPASITTPVKTSVEALNIALQTLNVSEDDYFMGDDGRVQPVTALKYAFINGNRSGKVTLCYELKIATMEPAYWMVYVNAVNGTVEYYYNGQSHANGTGATLYSGNKAINTKKEAVGYSLIDTARKIETRNFRNVVNTNVNSPNGGFIVKDPNNVFDSTDQKYCVDVHWGLGVTYDYYLQTHGRNSYDGAGSTIKGNVRWDKDYNNAFFSPATNQMYFGKGDGTDYTDWVSLDVIGHEFSHSLVNATANLTYQGESGALNESFADIFGHCIEAKGKGVNWALFEEIFTPANAGDAVRNMDDPNKSGNTGTYAWLHCPDTYKGTFWKSTASGAYDAGGVHFNSGVQNFWFYLLTVGGNGTNDAPLNHAYSVTGIGQVKSEKIAYRALTMYLTAGSDYKAARKAALSAAEDLYPSTGNQKSNEYIQTCNAWYAVGVGEKCCDKDSLDLTFKVKDTRCFNTKDGEIELTVKKKGNVYVNCDYRWHKGDTASSVLATSKDIQNLDSGNYYVIVKDTIAKCEVLDKARVNKPEKVKVTVAGGTTIIGACQRTYTVTLTASASGGHPSSSGDPYTWNWPNAIKQVTCGGSSGFSNTYTAIATDSNGCKGNGSAIVTYIPVVCSYDPNEIIGPPSFGDQKWVSVNATLPYKIRFENDPKFATAPAQRVRIDHKLDSNVDLTSFRVGSFGFYHYEFDVPNNISVYYKRLDIRDSFGLYLDVTAGLDVSNRSAFWEFQSIDPKTGLPPTAGDAGFLGINDTITHKGEGFVNYTIRPRNNSKTGDSIRAKAVIVFDDNPEVLTPRIHNLIDAVPPTSSIKTVPAIIDSALFQMTLRGQDDPNASGLAYFDIYVSENGAAYQAYAKEISDTVLGFNGNFGSSYKAYTIATDNTGNRETAKADPDVTFSIASKDFFRPLPGAISLCAGDTFNIRWFRSFFNGISLEYTADSGITYNNIATNLSGTDTLYRWKVPTGITGINNYFLRAIGPNNNVLDTSEWFELKQGPAFDLGPDTSFCDQSTFSLNLDPGSGYSAYKWSDSSSNQTLSVNNYGTYWVKVMASTGCSNTDQITISRDLLPVISSKTVVSVKCFGDSTGSIDLVVVSGSAPYQYLWSNSETTQDLAKIPAGSYSVIISDSRKCSIYDTSIITEPASPLALSSTQTNVDCNGNATGSIDLSVTGGTITYTYVWTASNGGSVPSGQANNQDLSGLVAGDYSVAVTDKNGCTQTKQITITQPGTPLGSSLSSINVSC